MFNLAIRDEDFCVQLFARDVTRVLDVVLPAILKEVSWITNLSIEIFPHPSKKPTPTHPAAHLWAPLRVTLLELSTVVLG